MMLSECCDQPIGASGCCSACGARALDMSAPECENDGMTEEEFTNIFGSDPGDYGYDGDM